MIQEECLKYLKEIGKLPLHANTLQIKMFALNVRLLRKQVGDPLISGELMASMLHNRCVYRKKRAPVTCETNS